jgi:hypothetical protein
LFDVGVQASHFHDFIVFKLEFPFNLTGIAVYFVAFIEADFTAVPAFDMERAARCAESGMTSVSVLDIPPNVSKAVRPSSASSGSWNAMGASLGPPAGTGVLVGFMLIASINIGGIEANSAHKNHTAARSRPWPWQIR